VKPESYQEVYLPIAPQVEQGMITVKIQTHTQIRQQVFEIELEIMVGLRKNHQQSNHFNYAYDNQSN
jgi:hypothetical protein